MGFRRHQRKPAVMPAGRMATVLQDPADGRAGSGPAMARGSGRDVVSCRQTIATQAS